MERYIAVLVLLVVSALQVEGGGHEEYYPGSLAGLSGEELMEALRIAVRNRENVMTRFDENMLWDIFNETDRCNDGSVWDMFSPDKIEFLPGGGIPAGMSHCHVAYPEWAGDKVPYAMDISLDLHNVFPCASSVAGLKQGLIPWNVDDAALFDNGVVAIGNASIEGTIFTAYEPCDEYKGDVARVLMYVAACYGGEFVWQGGAWNLFLEGSYPVFNKRARELMLAWHKSDPVGLKEQERNDAVYEKQGNRNPFVDYPWLADHIWGELAEVPFGFDEGNDDAADDFLRSTYAPGDTIRLRSSYVPSGAIWSVDGRIVAEDYIPANELGLGLHELFFSAGEMKGKVTIEIK